MAVKTFYLKDVVPSGATLHRSLQDGGTAPTAATTTTGWNPGTNAAGQCCLQNGGTEVARGTGWSTTLHPTVGPSATAGDCWRSESPLSGTFANTNWVFTFALRSVTQAFAGRFRLAVRVWKSANQNGVSATELTTARVVSAATTANMSTSADTTVTVTWTPGATKTLVNEYLFFNVGVEVTTAGGNVNQDMDFRVGTGIALVTPDFVADVIVALTTQVATVQRGTTDEILTIALAGQEADTLSGNLTASVGVADIDVPLTGQEADTSFGTFAPISAYSRVLTGQEADTEQGTLTPISAYSRVLTGSQIATQRGTFTPALTAALTGVQVAAQQWSSVPAASVQLSGQQASAQLGILTPTISAVVALSGLQTATQQSSLGVVSGYGAILTGQEATVVRGAPVSALTLAATGSQASVQRGSYGTQISYLVALGSGQATTVVSGVMAPAIAELLAGSTLATSRGSFSISTGGIPISAALTGLQMNVQRGVLKPNIPVATTPDALRHPLYIRQSVEVLYAA